MPSQGHFYLNCDINSGSLSITETNYHSNNKDINSIPHHDAVSYMAHFQETVRYYHCASNMDILPPKYPQNVDKMVAGYSGLMYNDNSWHVIVPLWMMQSHQQEYFHSIKSKGDLKVIMANFVIITVAAQGGSSDDQYLISCVGIVFKIHWAVYTGLILGLRPANERRRYFVTTSLISWVQA